MFEKRGRHMHVSCSMYGIWVSQGLDRAQGRSSFYTLGAKLVVSTRAAKIVRTPEKWTPKFLETVIYLEPWGRGKRLEPRMAED